MLGNPKFKNGDRVQFQSQQEHKVGVVYIVDSRGSWAVPDEVSYDIMATNESCDGICLYKHIAEQYVAALNNDETHSEELLYIESKLRR